MTNKELLEEVRIILEVKETQSLVEKAKEIMKELKELQGNKK